jgi:hypothetical protein
LCTTRFYLLRGFSSKRLLDLHFLTIAFALTMIAAPFVFLVDLEVDRLKLLFFLEHEAVEILIAVRVLAPTMLVANHSGAIVFLLYCLLVALSVPVVMREFFSHPADIVAWGAFTSDFLLGISGLTQVLRWIRRGRKNMDLSAMARKKYQAEAVSGVGFMCHGTSVHTLLPSIHRLYR